MREPGLNNGKINTIATNCQHIVDHFPGKYSDAYEVLKKRDKVCQLANIELARLFAHSCFNIDNLAFQFGNPYLGKGYELIQKTEFLYPNDPQITARVIGSKVSILQSEYFAEKLEDENLLTKLAPLESRLLKFSKMNRRTDGKAKIQAIRYL